MKVIDFVTEFKEKKIANTKINENAVSNYLKEHLEIKTYLPFRLKRQIVEMVVTQNTICRLRGGNDWSSYGTRIW